MSYTSSQPASVTAIVGLDADQGSEWIMAAYPSELTAAQVANLDSLRVGDLIKMPHAPDNDYLTILQIVELTQMRNVSTSNFMIGDGTGNFIQANNTINVPSVGTPSKLCAYRVNRKLPNLQWPPLGTYHVETTTSSGSTSTQIEDFKTVEYTKRHLGRYLPQEFSQSGAQDQGRFYDCFRQARMSQTPMKLTMPLDTSHSLISAVQLVGYSFMDKQSVGTPNHHQLHDDEWYALRITGVNGSVLSNNHAAKHAFCIVNGANVHVDKETGASRVHAYAPTGIVTEHFSPKNFSSINVEVVDRFGNPPRYGRLHLWLRLLCHRR